MKPELKKLQILKEGEWIDPKNPRLDVKIVT